jgi:hypothetical protein
MLRPHAHRGRAQGLVAGVSPLRHALHAKGIAAPKTAPQPKTGRVSTS